MGRRSQKLTTEVKQNKETETLCSKKDDLSKIQRQKKEQMK